jgi:hypothetical protein
MTVTTQPNSNFQTRRKERVSAGANNSSHGDARRRGIGAIHSVAIPYPAKTPTTVRLRIPQDAIIIEALYTPETARSNNSASLIYMVNLDTYKEPENLHGRQLLFTRVGDKMPPVTSRLEYCGTINIMNGMDVYQVWEIFETPEPART